MGFKTRMFAMGDVGIPALGMEAIPKQVGSLIEPDRFRFDSKVQSIDHALPDQPTPAPDPMAAVGELRPGIFVCGEYGSLPSIQWALLSGRLAAEAVSAALAH